MIVVVRKCLVVVVAVAVAYAAAGKLDRPNTVWITCEDMGPTIGCYGDADAHKPALDESAVAAARPSADATSAVRSCARSMGGESLLLVRTVSSSLPTGREAA